MYVSVLNRQSASRTLDHALPNANQQFSTQPSLTMYSGFDSLTCPGPSHLCGSRTPNSKVFGGDGNLVQEFLGGDEIPFSFLINPGPRKTLVSRSREKGDIYKHMFLVKQWFRMRLIIRYGRRRTNFSFHT